jgi:hypothetical protein
MGSCPTPASTSNVALRSRRHGRPHVTSSIDTTSAEPTSAGNGFCVAIARRTPKTTMRLDCLLLRRHNCSMAHNRITGVHIGVRHSGASRFDRIVPTACLVQVSESSTVEDALPLDEPWCGEFAEHDCGGVNGLRRPVARDVGIAGRGR